MQVSDETERFNTGLQVFAFWQKLCPCCLGSEFLIFCELVVDGFGTCGVNCHESKFVDLADQPPTQLSKNWWNLLAVAS